MVYLRIIQQPRKSLLTDLKIDLWIKPANRLVMVNKVTTVSNVGDLLQCYSEELPCLSFLKTEHLCGNANVYSSFFQQLPDILTDSLHSASCTCVSKYTTNH